MDAREDVFKRAGYHPHYPDPTTAAACLANTRISASPENLVTSEPPRCEETKENNDKGNSLMSVQQTLEKSRSVQIRFVKHSTIDMWSQIAALASTF